MKNMKNLLIFFCMVLFVKGLHAQNLQTDKMLDLLDLIRREKFDLVLPQAMRDNKIDMWIHVMRDGNPDPLALDLGGHSGYFIFTDRGDNRIERAVLGGGGDLLRKSGTYDIFGSEDDLKQFVMERDPEFIAINMSEWIAVADGLSYTGYLKLAKILGDKYAKRLISAGQLITDFRARRVPSEIVLYGKLGEITLEIAKRALSNEVITPGVTTLEDVAWWIKKQQMTHGVGSPFHLPSVWS